MTDGAADERRRQRIEARIASGALPGALRAEEPTWIPTSYVVGQAAPVCHYCGEPIGADEALLVRDRETCHPACEEAWRDRVTGERGDAGHRRQGDAATGGQGNPRLVTAGERGGA